MCPEILATRRGARISYFPVDADLWAASVVVYFMIVGQEPFEQESDVLAGDWLPSAVLSRPAARYFREAFRLDPSRRMRLGDAIEFFDRA